MWHMKARQWRAWSELIQGHLCEETNPASPQPGKPHKLNFSLFNALHRLRFLWLWSALIWWIWWKSRRLFRITQRVKHFKLTKETSKELCFCVVTTKSSQSLTNFYTGPKKKNFLGCWRTIKPSKVIATFLGLMHKGIRGRAQRIIWEPHTGTIDIKAVCR